MKTGLSLQALAAELERQVATRQDFIAPQGALEAILVDGAIALDAKEFHEPVAITPFAHGQLAAHLDIPKKYYDRMSVEQPALLATNINAWLKADPGNKRMLRTLDKQVRGILSPKFRALDNFELAQAALPVLIEKQAEIVSCELTETRMYIKAILPGLSDELPEGLAYGSGSNRIGTDRGRVVSAIVISNSDIGAGTLRVEPSVFTTFCTNLAILKQAAMRKYHAGRANGTDDNSWEVFHDDTRRADDAAFWLKVRDITAAAFDEAQFRKAIEAMKASAGVPIVSDDLPAVVEAAVERLALPPKTNNGILKALAAGGDLTQWGLSSAITRVSADVDDYETATAMERAGGEVIAMAPREWKAIAEAVAA